MNDAITMTEAKIAKVALEKEIARLLKEFGDLCNCEVNMVHVRAAVWGAEETLPIAYRVEVDAKL